MTSIEWVRNPDGSQGETWNPVTGCTKVSPGCDHCYAERITNRFGGPGAFDTVLLHPERLAKPLHWRKPRMVFVNSMSDLFHDDVPTAFIHDIFGTMGAAQRHTFQILTKRPGRMASVLSAPYFPDGYREDYGYTGAWPLPNVWLGTSVETQKWADVRIPKLLETPAAVRFISCEPLLGPVDLTPWLPQVGFDGEGSALEKAHQLVHDAGLRHRGCNALDWVIVGGESGPGARPMDIAWLASIVEQCSAAGAPVFVKQDSGPKPGKQGRIPDEMWARKEMPDASR